MDIDSFAQCMQYIQTTQVKFSLDKLIPVGAALGGAGIGFTLNYWSSIWKEKKSIKNKMMCCEENVEQIQKHIAKLVEEICKVCIPLSIKREITSHGIPLDVSFLYLNEYFIDVAHKYSKSQRESIQGTMASLTILNNELPDIALGCKVSAYEYSQILLNIANIAMNAWAHCEDFRRGEAFQQDEDKVAESFCSTGEQFQAYQFIKANAQADNGRLGLAVVVG